MGPTIDARADQFSFCVALYESLYGAHPLKGSTSVSMLEEGEKALAPPEAKGVPSAISKAVMRGLEKERQKRWPTMMALMQELTPPPQRSPMKFIAMAAIGAVAVTAATAAVLTSRPDPQRIIEAPRGGEAEVRLLFEEIQKKDAQIKLLIEQLEKSVKDREELERLRQQLAKANEEMQQLTAEVIKLKAKQVPNAKPIEREITSKQVTDAIQVVQSNVQFCLQDIDSRVLATEGAPKNRAIDAVVRFSTTPLGTAFDFKTSGIDYTPSVKLCIEDSLGRVAYPKGTDTLDVRVTISWAAGNLTMLANVVGQREGSNLKAI
jgi:hypothetical protein